MDEGLRGHVALFTGPPTPLTVTVARWMGNAGVRLAFAGPRVGADPGLQPLLCQFRRDVLCLDVDLADPQAVQETAEQTECGLGALDMLIHTLGCERSNRPVDLLDPSTQAVVWSGRPPLRAALCCSRGAMRFMARQQHGHILHLVTRADVGALEIERLVLNRLRQSWWQDGAPQHVTMSAVYFEEVTALGPVAEPRLPTEPRLLEMYTGRLLEEEGWIGKVMIEQEIGRLMQQICRTLGRGTHDPIQSFDFSPLHPITDGGTITLMPA